MHVPRTFRFVLRYEVKTALALSPPYWFPSIFPIGFALRKVTLFFPPVFFPSNLFCMSPRHTSFRALYYTDFFLLLPFLLLTGKRSFLWWQILQQTFCGTCPLVWTWKRINRARLSLRYLCLTVRRESELLFFFVPFLFKICFRCWLFSFFFLFQFYGLAWRLRGWRSQPFSSRGGCT